MRTVEKKCWPEYFEKIIKGEKGFELRLADFEISRGDTLVLKEWNPETRQYTGRQTQKKAGRITRINNLFGMYNKEDIEKHGILVIEIEEEK